MTVTMNDVRWLHNDVIEKKSWELICNFSKEEQWNISTPIPVETIAEVYLGYQISITDEGIFSDPSVLGGIIFEENTIQVNGAIENQEGRFNFTVAHELGHHSLHKNWLYAQRSQQRLFDDVNAPSILCREEGKKPRGEVQADKFAAALLMPEHLVLNTFKKKYKRRLDVSKRGLKSFLPMSPEYKANRIAENVIDAGGFTNVSRIAMVNRLLHFKLISGVDYQRNTTEDIFQFALGKPWKEIMNVFQYHYMVVHLRKTNIKEELFKPLDMNQHTFFSVKKKLIKAGFSIPNIKDKSKEFDPKFKTDNLRLYIENHLIKLTWKDAHKRFEKDVFRFLFQQYGFQKRKMESVLQLSYPSIWKKLKEIGSDQQYGGTPMQQ